jgi:hypothetical protein
VSTPGMQVLTTAPTPLPHRCARPWGKSRPAPPSLSTRQALRSRPRCTV